VKPIRKLASALLMTAASAAAVAEYPDRPIKILVPFAAGGPSDAIARTLGRALSPSIGQPVIVENRPGAEGQIAAQATFAAPPDGYTIFLGGSSSTVALAALKRDLPFDPLEFTPVTTVAGVAWGLFVNRDVPAKSVEELVRHARANPGKLSYAVSANTEFMAASQFMKATGARMLKVPFKGSAQAIPELIAGRVDVYFCPITPERIAYSKDGRLRLLATVAAKRNPLLPEVPTMAEAGIAGISIPNWNVLVGPPRMPAAVAERLAREVGKVLKDPEVRAQFANLALEAGSSTPQELRAMQASDSKLWHDFVREHDIQKD
jgi:tripartite-type tricarboxylate transporter receptor subunit TctC